MSISNPRPTQGGHQAAERPSLLAILAGPAVILVLLAAFYWAIFAPATPQGKSTPSPTAPPVAAQPTQGPTLAATVTPMLATPTLPVLPVLALTTPSPSPWPTPGPGTRPAPQLAPGSKALVAETGRSGLNLRSDAGTSFPRVGSVPEGFVVEVLAGPKYADGYVWYQVKDEAGVTGWAAANFLVPQTQ